MRLKQGSEDQLNRDNRKGLLHRRRATRRFGRDKFVNGVISDAAGDKETGGGRGGGGGGRHVTTIVVAPGACAEGMPI